MLRHVPLLFTCVFSGRSSSILVHIARKNEMFVHVHESYITYVHSQAYGHNLTNIHVIESGVPSPSNPSIHIRDVYEDWRTSKVDRRLSGLFKRARPAPPSTSTIPFQFLESDCPHELDQL